MVEYTENLKSIWNRIKKKCKYWENLKIVEFIELHRNEMSTASPTRQAAQMESGQKFKFSTELKGCGYFTSKSAFHSVVSRICMKFFFLFWFYQNKVSFGIMFMDRKSALVLKLWIDFEDR